MSDVLVAKSTRETGTRPARRMRREGLVPAVLYGMGMEPQSIAFDWPELRRVLAAQGTAGAFTISVDGKQHVTLIKELQRHPLRRDVTHIDFLAIDPDLPVLVEVPLVLSDPEERGKVLLVLHSLEVTAKPAAIPSEIEVDESLASDELEIYLRQVVLPAGVTTEVDGDTLVAGPALGEDLEVEAEGEEAGEGAKGEAGGEAAGEAGAGED
jgi:large subunit ribosomal protein L25